MDLKEAVAMLKQEKLSRARPWSAISDDYLTAREFLSLIGIPGKGRDYRRTIRWLSMASSDRSDKNLYMPEYLKKCFREGWFVPTFSGARLRVRLRSSTASPWKAWTQTTCDGPKVL